MRDTTTMTLSTESVREALEEYLNRHFVPEHRCRVVKWERDTSSSYGAEQIVVTIEPVGEIVVTTGGKNV
jgi:hypothetical protein